MRTSRGKWLPAAHLLFLSIVLRDLAFGEITRLIVNMPPRHGKSELTSRYYPAWYLELWPERHVMLTSYEADFARTWGRKVRNLVVSTPEEFSVRITGDSKAADRWNTTAGGGMVTAGVGGAITGRGADLLIVDDPIKNREQADSRVYRDRLWEWWKGTAYTRLEPAGGAIVMNTRWHEDDLAGRILADEEDPYDWTVINLPAIAEVDETFPGYEYSRPEGAALWPERWPLSVVEPRMRAVGRREAAAQYQGRPAPEGGSIFRRQDFRYFRYAEDHYELLRPEGPPKRILFAGCWVAQTCDTAITAKSTSDWTVCTTFAVTPDHDLLILDVFRARLEVPDQIPALFAQRERYPRIRWQGVEPKASGKGLIQQAQRMGRPFRELAGSDIDKVTRAGPISVMYENGMVYHRSAAPWLDDLEAELLSFPNGTHDDQVDTLAYAGREAGTAELQVWI